MANFVLPYSGGTCRRRKLSKLPSCKRGEPGMVDSGVPWSALID